MQPKLVWPTYDLHNSFGACCAVGQHGRQHAERVDTRSRHVMRLGCWCGGRIKYRCQDNAFCLLRIRKDPYLRFDSDTITWQLMPTYCSSLRQRRGLPGYVGSGSIVYTDCWWIQRSVSASQRAVQLPPAFAYWRISLE